MFVGIGRAKESDEVCGLDSAGKIRGRTTVAHSQEGLDELARRLARWARLEPLSEETGAVRSVVQSGDDPVAQRVVLSNQLRSCLEAYWPGAAVIFADVCSEICLAFVERYPTPESAARLGEVRLGIPLKKASYSGRRSAAERLRSAPAGITGVETEDKVDAARSMVRVDGGRPGATVEERDLPEEIAETEPRLRLAAVVILHYPSRIRKRPMPRSPSRRDGGLFP